MSVNHEYFLMPFGYNIGRHYSFFIADNAETRAEWPTSFNQPVKSGVSQCTKFTEARSHADLSLARQIA